MIWVIHLNRQVWTLSAANVGGDTEEVREWESSSEAEYAQHWCTDTVEETSSPVKQQKVRKFKTDA